MNNKKIVQNIDGCERAGTFLIAEGFERRHDRVIKHIKNNYDLFLSMEKSFGSTHPKEIPTRRVKSAGRPIQEYLLNETQTIFLGTLFRTSSKKPDDPVLLFKAKLATEFVKLREQNLLLQKHKQEPVYQITRDAGKIVRKQATDAMKDFISYAESQGSQNADKYYLNITRMLNSLLFIAEGKYKNFREVLTTQQLMTVSSAEQIIDRGLRKGMHNKQYYKDIYKDIRAKVELFTELHGKSEVIEQFVAPEQINIFKEDK